MCVQIRASSPQPHQIGHAPSHHKKQRQCTLESINRAQLQLFDLTAVLQNVEQDLDFPSRPIPLDKFDRFIQRGSRTVGQQTPFDRLNAGRRVKLARNHARCSHAFALTRGQQHALQPQALPHRPRFHPLPPPHPPPPFPPPPPPFTPPP